MNFFLNLFKAFPKFQRRRFASLKYEYDMPAEYRNSFYLANASLDDSINWFIHNALSIVYNDLIYEFIKIKKCNMTQAQKEIANVINYLSVCNYSIEVQVPVKRNNGDLEVFRGYRAEHGFYVKDSPHLGGLRLSSEIVKSDVEAMALLSTFKYACSSIDLLGAHGGIAVNPKNLQENELKLLVGEYIKQLTQKKFCGTRSVFEPDLNSSSSEMQWIISSYSKLTNESGNTCAVGKAEVFGGVKHRETVLAHGIMCSLDYFLHKPQFMKMIHLEEGWKDKTFLLQGLGIVGSTTAQYLTAVGAKCVGVIEHDCHIYDRKGINVNEATRYKNMHGSLNGFLGKTKITLAAEVLVKPCDILILAATHKALPYFIADKIQASVIIEAANCALTPSVHKTLVLHKKLVLPDIIINAGSSIVSYLEYQNNINTLNNTKTSH